MWTTGRVWAVVRLPQIGCQDDLCERACWGRQGQGAGFSGRMSLWLLVDKVFAFLFSKLRRKRSTLWFMVEWDFSHPWASENSGEAGCFQTSLSTSKAGETGCPLHLPDSMAMEKVRECQVIAHSPRLELSDDLHKQGLAGRASSLFFLTLRRPGTFFWNSNPVHKLCDYCPE